MALGNWLDRCWDADGRPLEGGLLLPVRGGRDARPGPRPMASILKHYVTVTDERDDVQLDAPARTLAQVHSGVVSLRGFTIVASVLDPSRGQEGPALFGGPGVMFLAFVGDDWAFHGPGKGLLGGGAGIFDPAHRHVQAAAGMFAEWATSLEAGPDVDQWVRKVTSADAWRLL